MKTIAIKLCIWVIGLSILTGCLMSQQITDKSAGFNGSFEISKRDLPVNWPLYSPKTVPDADFKILLDKVDFKEGKQSLRFDVTKCSNTGGWRSPGFTNEFFELTGPATFKISMWIKNNGAKFRITSGGVEVKGGDMKTLIESSENVNEWKRLEYDVDVPQNRWLRLQLNILEPGTFWIDDIRIDKK